MSASPSTLPSTAKRTIRVLIVDDSAVVRQMLTRQLSADSDIEIVGTAADPYAARDKLVALRPDVMTLDVEMPKMDGISFLRKLMQFSPMPVIVLSSLAAAGSQTAIDALSAGAVDVVAKPGSAGSVDNLGPTLIRKIKLAAGSAGQLRHLSHAEPGSPVSFRGGREKIFAIGASTGGVQALSVLLKMLPANSPPTVIVQHMPPRFTASFAERLNQACSVRVKEAADGDSLEPGHVLIAPGGFHMLLRRSGPRYYVEVRDGPEVLHQKPSVDVLFTSVAKAAGKNTIAALLTGMGADGARGMLDLLNAGAQTIAQDKDSCVVFGMPAEAIKRNAAQHILPLDQIAPMMLHLAAQAESPAN